MPTAFLTASTFEVLPFLGTPGAATVGQALLWSESPKGFTLAPIGPDQFSGVLPVSKGGWGTNTGSFTSPGAITLTSGGVNQNINLNPSGSGSVSITADDLRITQRSNTNTNLKGISLFKDNYYFQATNGAADPSIFWPIFYGKSNLTNYPSLAFISNQAPGTDYYFGTLWFMVRATETNQPIDSSHKAFLFGNGLNSLLTILGSGNSIFHSVTESTSTTSGACVIAGGLGVAKNINIGGNLRFSGGTVPTTATSAGTTGDIRYDGNYLYICTATNTWRRAALSTW